MDFMTEEEALEYAVAELAKKGYSREEATLLFEKATATGELKCYDEDGLLIEPDHSSN